MSSEISMITTWNTKYIHLFTLIVFITIAIASYGAYYTPAIYSDDWSLVINRFMHGGSWIDWNSSRPLGPVTFGLLLKIFGLNIKALYIIAGIFYIITAIQLYFLALKLLSQRYITAMAIGAIFIIYPVLYTRMWLTFINYTVVVCLVLVYAWLLLLYVQNGRLITLVGALLCVIVSIMMVEAPLGVILAWCALLSIINNHQSWKRRLITLISPTIISVIFIIWRAKHAFQQGDTAGYVINTPISIKLIISSIILGLKVLIWGWTEPIRYLFGYQDNKLPLLFIGLSILILMFGTFIVLNIKGFDSSNFRPFLRFSRSELMTVCILFIVGVILVIAGYIPVILMFIPNLSGTLTRVNTFASIGASIALVAMVNIGALLLGRNRMQVDVIMGITVIPFIVLGVITQIWVQQSTQVAWLEQKQIWNELFNIAPNLDDGTTVYLVLPGYEDRVGFTNWRRLPLMGDWDATGALQVLYNDASLHGDVIYPDIETPVEPTLTDKGIVHYWEGKVTPYDQALFVIFAENPKHLKVVTDLQAVLSVSWSTPTYMPYQHILVNSPPVIELRRLVDQ